MTRFKIPCRSSILLAALVASGWAMAPASASAAAPRWQITSASVPSSFAPGDMSGNDTYVIYAENVGDGSTCDPGSDPTCNGPTISDTLPAGLTATSVEFYVSSFSSGFNVAPYMCTTSPVQCQYPGPFRLGGIPLDTWIELVVHVTNALTEGTSLTNSVAITGDGAPDATASVTNQVSASSAPFGVQNFSTSAINEDGSPATQAGGHPWALTTSFQIPEDDASGQPDGLKDTEAQLPPGLVGNPTATPQCAQQNLDVGGNCPTDTQIGTFTLNFFQGGLLGPVTGALYNLVPQSGQTAVFGASVAGVQIRLISSVRSDGDYGVTVSSPDIPEVVPLFAASVTVWGVPADPSHDVWRFRPQQSQPGDEYGNPLPAGITPAPFLIYPFDCSAGPLTTTLSADSWPDPGAFVSASSSLPAPTGCGNLQITSPSLSVQPQTSQAGAPSGYEVDLSAPQDMDPYSLATPPLKDVSVTLPEGVALSAPAANGLSGCTDAELGLHSLAPAACPDSSRVGTVEIDTPLLPGPLTGSIYVGTQLPGDPYRIFLVAQGDGVTVKLAGDVHADPATGQLTSVFDNNPQVAFSELKLDFFGGADAALSNPPACGTYTTSSDITPYGDALPDQSPQDSFTISQGCGTSALFSPSLSAGLVHPQAGAFTSFLTDLTRPDGQENVSGLTVTLPPGVSAKLAGVPLCPDADAASGNCPTGSQVGTVTAAIGDGPEPLYLPQPGAAPTAVYLAGPYKGAPYSLVIVVPAQAGPYNLGTITVRAALYIDPTDAHVTVVSDPLPQIVMGVPNQYRRIFVDINRPNFTLAPTSCAPMEASAAVTGVPLGGPVSVNPAEIGFSTAAGQTATIASPLQVGDCSSLGFSPKLSISLTGRGRTHSGNHPTLTATLTQPGGQANIRSAKVALPLSLALDTNNSQKVCNYDVAQAVHGGAVGCPASTIVGQATAITPLLSQPLSGPVYLVQGIRFGKQGQRIHTLPSLLVPLRGQVALDLRASSAVNGAQQLVTTFSTIPDAPVSKFTLTVNGGPKGILVITGRGLSICGKAQVANTAFGAQSGASEAPNPRLATPACAGFHAKRHTRRHSRRHGKRGRAEDRRR